MSIIGCIASKISCEPDHIIIVESSVYGVHKTNESSYCSTEYALQKLLITLFDYNGKFEL